MRDLQIIKLVGRGEIGHVYKGYEKSLNRHVAIKVLSPVLARSAEHVRRFRAEAAAAARVTHPNVVPIYSIGEDSGHHFFVMQWVDGESLAERLCRQQSPSLDEALDILKQCLAGLRAAHDRKVMHGNVNPGDILLERATGRVMLVDFGMASVKGLRTLGTATSTDLRTSQHAAPEQALGGPADHRADLYALGVTTYQMLAGRMPFPAEASACRGSEHEVQGPLPLQRAAPDVPAALGDIVARMIRARPEDRYQDAEDVLADIRAFERGEPAATCGPTGLARGTLATPDFGPTPELPPSTLRWLKPKWWQVLRQRAWSLFRAFAPEVAKELQTTEQQVDDAVAEYQRRDDTLGQLVGEAEGIARRLALRKESSLQAAAEAAHRVASATDETERKQARQNLEHSRQAIAELAEQESLLEQQLGDLRVQKDRAHAKLLELVNQRDLLRARLQRARLRLRPDARTARWKPVVLTIVGGLMLLVAAAVYSARLWPWARENVAPLRTVARKLDAEPSPVAERQEPEPPNPEVPGPEPPNPEVSGPEPPNPEVSGPEPPAQEQPPALQPSVPLDLSVYPVSMIRAFDGPPPPYVLSFSGKQSVHFEMPEIGWDWMSRSYTVVLAARLEASDKPVRLMGSLDTRPSDPPKPGWALLLLPVDERQASLGVAGEDPNPKPDLIDEGKDAAGSLESDGAKQARLALLYAASGGRLCRLVGPPFEPRDQWWRITVSQSDHAEHVAIHLGETQYLEASPDDMIRTPGPTHFWLGCPDFADEGFWGDIGGFAIHGQDYASAPRLALGRQTRALFSFSHAPDGLVFDFSGSGSHGELIGCEWVPVPERPLPLEIRSRPAAGKALAVTFSFDKVLELLGTRGLVGLDGTFTAEMWVRGLNASGEHILISDWVESHGSSAVFEYAGWALTLSDGASRSCHFQLWYPHGRGGHGRIESGSVTFDGAGWHHVALCNTPARRQIYLNGKPLLRDESDQTKEIQDHWVPSPVDLFVGNRGRRSTQEQSQVRAFRLSSCRRYEGRFTPPPEFKKDEHTLVLLDFSHRLSGPFIPDVSGGERRGLRVIAPWIEVDKTWGQ